MAHHKGQISDPADGLVTGLGGARLKHPPAPGSSLKDHLQFDDHHLRAQSRIGGAAQNRVLQNARSLPITLALKHALRDAARRSER